MHTSPPQCYTNTATDKTDKKQKQNPKVHKNRFKNRFSAEKRNRTSSTLWMACPRGMSLSCKTEPGVMGASRPPMSTSPTRTPWGARWYLYRGTPLPAECCGTRTNKG